MALYLKNTNYAIDFLIITSLLGLFAAFIFSTTFLEAFIHVSTRYAFGASFVKFALLASLGEIIGLRLSTGSYFKKGFGLAPRALVWGILGMGIYIAFVVFSSGTTVLLEKHGFATASTLPMNKLLIAFTTSTLMNLIFAPVMMTLHKVTDTHILATGGSLSGFFTPISFGRILHSLDWKTHYSFVIARSIPFFWIPAHTLTFLLPNAFRVLFAAMLGIILGIILSYANRKARYSISERKQAQAL